MCWLKYVLQEEREEPRQREEQEEQRERRERSRRRETVCMKNTCTFCSASITGIITPATIDM